MAEEEATDAAQNLAGLAAVGSGLGIAGVGLSIASGIMSNMAARAEARRLAAIAEANARGFERQAVDVHFRSKEEQRESSYIASQARGALRAAGGAAGLTDFGSIALAEAALASRAARNAAIIGRNAMNASRELVHQAKIARMGGQVAASGARGRGIAALFSGVSSGVSTLADTFSPQRRPLARSGTE